MAPRRHFVDEKRRKESEKARRKSLSRPISSPPGSFLPARVFCVCAESKLSDPSGKSRNLFYILVISCLVVVTRTQKKEKNCQKKKNVPEDVFIRYFVFVGFSFLFVLLYDMLSCFCWDPCFVGGRC